MLRRDDRRVPVTLLAAFAALFAAWSLVVPINEGPDEPAHWQYARYLHDHWRLPAYQPGFEEANSPPLAYVLFAPLAVDASSPDIVLGRRPDGTWWSLAPPRTFLNTDQAFRQFWPLRLARLVACAISLVTVLFVWRAGLVAGGREVGLIAASIAALLPMFAFRAGQISNDALLGCFAAMATWGMVRLRCEPFSWRVAWLTSAAVGLAYLAKINAIALLPPFALALWLARPAPTWRGRFTRLGALALAAAIVAPWSVRNVALYGDPFASHAMRTAVAHIITDRPLWSPFFVDEFPRVLTKSFIGIFGWGLLEMPSWTYRPYLLLFAVGLAGAGLAAVRKRLDWRLVAILSLAGLAALAVVVRINLQFTQMQGRYLLPALPAFAVLMGLGLRALRPRVAALASPRVLGVLLAVGNLYALLGVVVPAYYPAPTRTLDDGTRVLLPTHLNDLAIVDGENHFLVTGTTPYWTAPVDARAETFATFEVELAATATPTLQRGCVAHAAGRLPRGDDPTRCFEWTADGTRQTIRVPLRDPRGSAAVLTHLRLEPFAARTGRTGVTVWTTRPRLVP